MKGGGDIVLAIDHLEVWYHNISEAPDTFDELELSVMQQYKKAGPKLTLLLVSVFVQL